MAIITQKVPSFFSICEPFVEEFHTTEELLNIPFIHSFTETDDGNRDRQFHRFSLSGNNLVVEGTGEFKWVIGIIDNIEGVNLPKTEK